MKSIPADSPPSYPNPTAEDMRMARAFLQATPNRVECSWCGLVTKQGREPVSHTICAPCAKDHFGVNLTKEDACPP